MADLTQKDRLQPSLLDRLTDTDPERKQESRDARVISPSRLINYGMPDMAGRTTSGINTTLLEQAIRRAILDFEPRLVARTLRVKLVVEEKQMNHNAMSFDIEAELWAQPLPLRLFLRTAIDLEDGTIDVRDLGNQGGG
jgi:type VI secretion system protein ImpF